MKDILKTLPSSVVLRTTLKFEKTAFQKKSSEGTQQNRARQRVLPVLYLQNPAIGIKYLHVIKNEV